MFKGQYKIKYRSYEGSSEYGQYRIRSGVVLDTAGNGNLFVKPDHFTYKLIKLSPSQVISEDKPTLHLPITSAL